MTKFELFCVIFFALDSEWEKSHDEDLGLFLSDVNPFWWADIASADPAMWSEFCRKIPSEEILVEESYSVASKYIEDLNYYYAEAVRKAFHVISKEQWLEGVNKYLSQPHKNIKCKDLRRENNAHCKIIQ